MAKRLESWSLRLILCFLVSCSSALPWQVGRKTLPRDATQDVSSNHSLPNTVQFQAQNLHCFGPAHTDLLVDVDDCTAALREWKSLAEEDGDLQSFSHKKAGLDTDDEVPMGMIKGSCLAMLDLDAAHSTETDIFSFWTAYHALSWINHECVLKRKIASGGMLRIGNDKGFFVTIRNPKASRNMRAESNLTGSIAPAEDRPAGSHTNISTNLTKPPEFGVNCFHGIGIPRVSGADCREALQQLRYAQGLQVFSLHPAAGEKPVPYTWYGGIHQSCEIRLGLLDPNAQPADLRVPLPIIGELAGQVVEKCVSNSASKQGGVTHLTAVPEIPSPWGIFVGKRGMFANGPLRALPSNGTTASSENAALTVAASVDDSRQVSSPVGFERRSDGNLTSPGSTPSSSPRCFSRGGSPVPITLRDCFPAIHNMMTADGQRLWHHPVRWGAAGGLSWPRVFFSRSCKITITSFARPAYTASDTFSLEEAGNNVRDLINSCNPFHGGYIGVGHSGTFFVEVEGAHGALALGGENTTTEVEASPLPAINSASAATE